jgi:hypothetical protein
MELIGTVNNIYHLEILLTAFSYPLNMNWWKAEINFQKRNKKFLSNFFAYFLLYWFSLTPVLKPHPSIFVFLRTLMKYEAIWYSEYLPQFIDQRN